MRLRFCVLLSIVALCATTLMVATAGTTHGATEATAAATPAGRADSLSHGRSAARIGLRPEPGLLFRAFEGPVIFPPHARQGRPSRAVLLDGSDRWRSLLLGAPPLFA